MHNGNIENYSFIHGQHRNLINGKWFPLHPHTLGRPLTHDEMDYNLLYSQQTLAGWRIFGKNDDLTLSDVEINKSLIFWKINSTDLDYARYTAAGYVEGQYIWITRVSDCSDFTVASGSSTDASEDLCQGFIITLAESTETDLTPSATATPVPTAEPTATPVPTAEPTATPVPTAEPTATPVPTAEPTATPVPPTATPVPPTATATSVPTATPTPTPSATPIGTRDFAWNLSTDETFATTIEPVLEDLDNDPNGAWANSFFLQQQNANGMQLEYFPLQPGNTYYLKIHSNIGPVFGTTPTYTFNSGIDGLTLEHESNSSVQGVDVTSAQIGGLTGNLPYLFVKDADNSYPSLHTTAYPGWLPSTQATQNEYGGSAVYGGAYLHIDTLNGNPQRYLRIEVPETMPVGTVFKLSSQGAFGANFYDGPTNNDQISVNHLSFTPGLYGDINFKVIENPNLAPTPTPSPTYDLSSASAVSANGQWSLHVTDHDSGQPIQPVVVDLTQAYNDAGGSGPCYYKYYPIAANEKVKVHVEQHFGTLIPYASFVVYNQNGYSSDSADNTGQPINFVPNLLAFAGNASWIDNKLGTDVLPTLNHPNEMIQIALNTPSEPFIVGRPANLGSIGKETQLWINEQGASGMHVNLVSLPDGLTPPTTLEELQTPYNP